jgi:hypothetical protein
VYELHNKHFGNKLIDVDVKTDTYDIKGGEIYPNIYDVILNSKKGIAVSENLLDSKWEIINYPSATTKEIDGILEIDYNEIYYAYAVKEANIKPDIYYRLSGYIKTEELFDKEGICLEVQDMRGWKYLDIITEKIFGTTNWTFVHSIFKTPPGSDSVIVLARRFGFGKGGPNEGKAYIKDVKLEQFNPDTRVPYLSVTASKSEDGNKIYLMVINKNMSEAISAFVEIKEFQARKKIETASGNDVFQAESWILNGPSIDSTNEKKADTVKIVNRKLEIKDASFEFTFEPHSLTAIEISRKE